jgi:hypothetical protein
LIATYFGWDSHAGKYNPINIMMQVAMYIVIFLI